MYYVYCIQYSTKALDVQASIIRCLSQARINWEGYGRVQHKNGDGGSGGTDSPDGVASRQFVGASASVIFPCTIKSKSWQAVTEEVDKGCSKFCVTVGVATSTAGVDPQSVKGAGCKFEPAIWPTLIVCWLNWV